MLKVGSIVVVEGLKNASQHNGKIGIFDHRNEENDRFPVHLLDDGKELSIKESNLTKCNRDSPHWMISETEGTVMERILGEPEKDLTAVWNEFFETVPANSLAIGASVGGVVRNQTRDIILRETGHKIYWLVLDAIQHHLIIEKCGGRYRLLQTYIKEEGIGGYTAEEWSTCGSLSSQASFSSVQRVYGGGLMFGNKEFARLLDVILELQKLVSGGEMIPHLLAHVDQLDPADVLLLQKEEHDLSPSEFERAQDALQTALKWGLTVESLVGPYGLTVLSTNPVRIVQGSRPIFTIRVELYQRVSSLMQQVTAQSFLLPVVFLKMINSGIWWKSRQDPQDSGAVGFGIRAAALDWHQSYEAGLVAAAKHRDTFRARTS